MKKRIVLLLLFITLICTLVGCGCEHEWNESDCLTPKTCTLCGETEGEPLGHAFLDATCTTPKTCSLCSITDGDPLPHTPGDAVITTDYIRAVTIETQSCADCAAVLSTSEASISLVDGEFFCLSPEEFVARLNHIYTESCMTNWDAALEVESGKTRDFFMAVLRRDGIACGRVFFTSTQQAVTEENKNDRIVSHISVNIYYQKIAEQQAAQSGMDSSNVLDQIFTLFGDTDLFMDVLKPVIQACNPNATDAEAADFVGLAYDKTSNPFGMEEIVFQSECGDIYVEVCNFFLANLSYMINISTTPERWVNPGKT